MSNHISVLYTQQMSSAYATDLTSCINSSLYSSSSSYSSSLLFCYPLCLSSCSSISSCLCYSSLPCCKCCTVVYAVQMIACILVLSLHVCKNHSNYWCMPGAGFRERCYHVQYTHVCTSAQSVHAHACIKLPAGRLAVPVALQASLQILFSTKLAALVTATARVIDSATAAATAATDATTAHTATTASMTFATTIYTTPTTLCAVASSVSESHNSELMV
jgi:hypothetical protein